MDRYEPSTYGDAYADVYDDWYGLPMQTDAAVAFLAAAARDRPVLELGVGTGRVALPLAALGLEVWGVDASDAMLEQLRAKPGAGAVRTVRTDMATLALPDHAPRFGLAFAAFNTFFLLDSVDDQRTSLQRVRSLLEPGGRFVLELYVPPAIGPRGVVEVTSVDVDRLVLRAFRPVPGGEGVEGHHVELSAQGVRLRPWRLCPLAPDRLDELAGEAGFSLVQRCAGWGGEPFLDVSPNHVSVYEAVGAWPPRR